MTLPSVLSKRFIPQKYVYDDQGNTFKLLNEGQFAYIRYFCCETNMVARYDCFDNNQWSLTWQLPLEFGTTRIRILNIDKMQVAIESPSYDEKLLKRKFLKDGLRSFTLEYVLPMFPYPRKPFFILTFKKDADYAYFLFLFSEHIA